MIIGKNRKRHKDEKQHQIEMLEWKIKFHEERINECKKMIKRLKNE